jgi:hypothetical protein
MQTGKSRLGPLLLSVAFLLTISLTGCGSKASSPCPAPPLPTWSAQDSIDLAIELRQAARGGCHPRMIQAVEEYYAIREQIRACDR